MTLVVLNPDPDPLLIHILKEDFVIESLNNSSGRTPGSRTITSNSCCIIRTIIQLLFFILRLGQTKGSQENVRI